MEWELEYTDEFGDWWDGLTEKEQQAVRAIVMLLREFGPYLSFPYSSGIKGAKHGSLRELRIQCEGRPYRVLYAFDPRRCAILLMGGDKTGDDRWYEKNVPLAERIYDEHLKTLKDEGWPDG